MTKIGIFFGTDTGYTRKAAKLMVKQLSDVLDLDKPININRATVDDFINYDVLILGTPTYGNGVLPGKETGVEAGSWAEFLPQIPENALKDKVVALYGFGDQKKYSDRYVSAMGALYDAVISKGAKVIGQWPVDGYEFDHSNAMRNGQFVGLALDDKNQGAQTVERITRWLGIVLSELNIEAVVEY